MPVARISTARRDSIDAFACDNCMRVTSCPLRLNSTSAVLIVSSSSFSSILTSRFGLHQLPVGLFDIDAGFFQLLAEVEQADALVVAIDGDAGAVDFVAEVLQQGLGDFEHDVVGPKLRDLLPGDLAMDRGFGPVHLVPQLSGAAAL